MVILVWPDSQWVEKPTSNGRLKHIDHFLISNLLIRIIFLYVGSVYPQMFGSEIIATAQINSSTL